jgi:hypothetical protein
MKSFLFGLVLAIISYYSFDHIHLLFGTNDARCETLDALLFYRYGELRNGTQWKTCMSMNETIALMQSLFNDHAIARLVSAHGDPLQSAEDIKQHHLNGMCQNVSNRSFQSIRCHLFRVVRWM